MALDDRDPSVCSEPVEVRAAAGASIGDIRQIRIAEVAAGIRNRAVPGAVLHPKARGIVVMRRGDDVLDVGVRRGRRVQEVCGRPRRLAGKL